MTEILPTPTTWPSILLGDAADGSGRPGRADEAPPFAALRQAIAGHGPIGTIGAVVASGLRGRGGGGYPTGEKWRAAAAMDASRRYVVANGYGADPAVTTDRTLMERRPAAVVEGAAIAAFAIGASEAIIAVRAEATAAIAALEAAIAAGEAAGRLGPDAIAPGRDLIVRVRTVQGAYMLGEETVLLKALEGRRGQPEQRPPHPTERGLFGAPTVVQNVQTLAALPWIFRHGPEAFAATGAPHSPGTILVQVRGPERTGIAEVPLGTRLGDIVDLGGAVAAGHRLKAILVGGPSGGILPTDALDTPYDFGPLREAGAHVGSGSVIAVDDRACVVDLARLLTRFCADEACGKTIPCRIGTRRLTEIGDRVVGGLPRPTDLQLLADLSHDMVESALCDHERLTTLPYMSGMRYFRAEIDDHVLRSSCPAGVCHPLAVTAAVGAQ